MKNTKQLLGLRIRELRKSNGLSQEQFSEKIGIDSKQLSRIELGKAFPYVETLEGIAKAFDVEIKELFEFNHLEKSIDLKGLGKLLEGVNEDKLRLIYKIIRAIVH